MKELKICKDMKADIAPEMVLKRCRARRSTAYKKAHIYYLIKKDKVSYLL